MHRRAIMLAALGLPFATAAHAAQRMVVTEYGVADLTPLDPPRRAQALIAIAAPAHRAALAEAWARLCR